MQAISTTPLFSATLRPDRSLSQAGGWVGLALAAVVGVPFLLAMPEFVLPGLTAFGFASTGMGALSVQQARRRKQSQTVTLWADQLELVTTAPGQKRSMQRFDLSTLRLRLVRDGFERTTAIFLRHGSEELELGPFLSVNDKSSFAKAFGGALRRARKAS